MTLLQLLSCLLLITSLIRVSSSYAQSPQSAVAARSDPTQLQPRIELLLRRESEELDHFQQQVAPAIRCDNTDDRILQACRDMLTKLRDEAQQAKRDIARYRTSSERQPGDLFDIYVELQAVLKDIQLLGVEDEFSGNRNREPVAQGYNSFVKLTDVWFTAEIRETMRSLTRQPSR